MILIDTTEYGVKEFIPLIRDPWCEKGSTTDLICDTVIKNEPQWHRRGEPIRADE